VYFKSTRVQSEIRPVNCHSQQHTGFHPYKMDPKFRVSIPMAWRPAPGGTLFLLFSQVHAMPVVKVLGRDAYDEKVGLIRNSDKTPAEKGRLLGRLAMLCREVTVNDQGKLLVPKDLSEKAGIAADSDVVLAGRGIHFEIWSKEHFDQVLAIETAQDEDDDLGIF
jgi:DNA-binding transcriptional regulator/RsmH inhibitor MraZ